jgi:outer membrane protein assembly factor BamB
MRSQFTVILAVILFTIGALPVRADESPWPMFRHDPKHTGRSPHTGPATPELKWTFQADDGIVSSPSIGHNGTIYVGAGGYHEANADSSFYAINPDGSLKWKFYIIYYDFTNGVFSSPAIAPDGTIYFGAGDKYIYAIEDSVSYGKLKWSTLLGFFPVYSSPVIGADGTVYIGTLDFQLNALRPEDGVRRWYHTTGWCIFSSPAIRDDGSICVGSKDHNLYVFEDSVTYGKVGWSYPAGLFYDGHLFDSSPAIGPDGTIYIGADPYNASGQTPVPIDTAFYAVNPDGSIKWKFVMDDGVESSPGIGLDGTVYVGSYDSCLYAIRDLGTEGELLWKFRTGGPVDASPTIDAAGIIYIGSRDSNMYAINPDGTERWSYPTGGGIESSVTINADGTIYFGSFDGKLYALGTDTPDVGVESIDLPEQVLTGATYNPLARIRNYRTMPQSFEVSCLIEKDASVIYSDTVEIPNLESGVSTPAVFSPWLVDPDSGAAYEITVYTLHAGDDNQINDTLVAVTVSDSEYAFVCGDANSSMSVDIDDIVHLINFIFSGGPPPAPVESGDAECSGGVDIDDVVYLINYVFASGPEPCLDCP